MRTLGRGEHKKGGQLPQSPPCGGDSPLFKAGAKIAPLRGARAKGPPFYSPVNNNLQHHSFDKNIPGGTARDDAFMY